MAVKSAWPTGAEVTTYLTGMGVTVPSGSSATDYVNDAVDTITRILGYNALDAGTSVDEFFDPPVNGYLALNREWLTITAVRAYVDTDDTDGELLVLGEDYFLYPDSAPFRVIRFGMVGAFPKSIKVTGTRGAAGVPVTLFNIARDLAASAAGLDAVMAGTAGGTLPGGAVIGIKQGQVEKRFQSPGESAGLVTLFNTLRDRAMDRLKAFQPLYVGGL